MKKLQLGNGGEKADKKEKHQDAKKPKETKQKAEERNIIRELKMQMGDYNSDSSSDDDRRNVMPSKPFAGMSKNTKGQQMTMA